MEMQLHFLLRLIQFDFPFYNLFVGFFNEQVVLRLEWRILDERTSKQYFSVKRSIYTKYDNRVLSRTCSFHLHFKKLQRKI